MRRGWDAIGLLDRGEWAGCRGKYGEGVSFARRIGGHSPLDFWSRFPTPSTPDSCQHGEDDEECRWQLREVTREGISEIGRHIPYDREHEEERSEKYESKDESPEGVYHLFLG